MTDDQHSDSDAAIEQAADALVQRTRRSLETIFDSLTAVARQLLALRRRCLDSDEPFTVQRMAELRDAIITELDHLPTADGVGVVAAPDLFPDRSRHLEWWHRAGDAYQPLPLNLDPTSDDLYDYFAMDWFAIPRDEGHPYVFGPYIDFSGADRYVLTLGVPIVDETFLGVAGADVRMSDFERDLLAVLRAAPIDAVIVNAERRVLAANTPRWVVGSKLRLLPAAGDGTFAAVRDVGADSGWVLALARPE